MIKPDAVQRSRVGKVIASFEQKGFKLCAMKLVTPGRAHMEKHYADHAGKSFFEGLIKFATSGPVLAMVWEGDNSIKTGRKMLGATKPFESNPGTLRGNNCIDLRCNAVHGSDSPESAEKEIALWFSP